MNQQEWRAEQFESYRSHLRAVAYRMLGSVSEADDAVQATWFRLSAADIDEIENLGGWLTTVVARVCLDLLRSYKSHPEEAFDEQVMEPIMSREDGIDPEHEALLADSVGRALLVVLDTLDPAERLAFVLHDMFAVPFDEIAPIVGRTPTAARQLASRARRRVQGTASETVADLTRQREVVTAFLAASRSGDFNALLTLLDPNVVFRADEAGMRLGASKELFGAPAVAENFAGRARAAQTALINGLPGVTWAPGGKPRLVINFTITNGKVTAMNLVADEAQLSQLDVEFFDN